jgi:hypothetical protein
MTYPANEDAIEEVLHVIDPVVESTVTLASGTAVQNGTADWLDVFVGITGGASGTVKVDIGPTSACADNLIPAAAGNAVASQTLTVPVPPGWFFKVTTTVATINAASVILQK